MITLTQRFAHSNSRPAAWAVLMLALPVAGCGDGKGGVPEVVAPTVELGETFSSEELRQRSDRLTPWGTTPAYVAPFREPTPIEYTPVYRDSGGLHRLPPPSADYREPSELVLTPPALDEPTASNDEWVDAWADWPEGANAADDEPPATEEPQPSINEPALIVARPLPRPEGGALFPPPATEQATTAVRPAEQVEVDPALGADLLTEVPAATEIGRLMAEPIREGFALGRSGAVFAARAKFEDALRRIATAKDAAIADDQHTRALAAGLRALDEARHFLPQGDALDESLDVETIARGHRTTLLHASTYERTLPQEAIARYHLLAAKQLAKAVEGEQAGSMALYGLGKSYARLAETSDEPLASRRSLAMYRAAILAHDGNYLAANELGVGLAQAGHYEAASRALGRAVTRGGGSTVHRNLAMVQRRLARPRLAMATEQRAEQIAMQERMAGAFSRRLGVQWVDPAAFARSGGDAPAKAPATVAQAQDTRATPNRNAAAASPRGPWRGNYAPAAPPRTAAVAPAAPLPGIGNRQATPVKSQTIVR